MREHPANQGGTTCRLRPVLAVLCRDGPFFGPAAGGAPAGARCEKGRRRLIEIQELTKVFGQGEASVTALDHVSLTVQTGDIYGIIGMSGAGKSTLLRCLSLLETPTSGRVLLDGRDIAAMSGAALRGARRKMGVVFQGYNLLMQKTVAQNVAFPLKLEKGWQKDAVEARVRELLELVGLADKAAAYPAQLSGGQKQRVAIARALATSPETLLCDEPTSALDPLTTQSMLKLLRDINRKLGVTILIITHELTVVSAICSHVAVIGEGRVAEQGAVETVFTAPQSPVTKQLLNREV